MRKIFIAALGSFLVFSAVFIGILKLAGRPSSGVPAPFPAIDEDPPLALEDQAILKQNERENLTDFIELNFPLVRISSPWFIDDLSYLKDDNFLKHSFYQKFGIGGCYVHRDIYPNMIRLEELLKANKLRAVVFDCFRPQEAQVYMWKLNPDPKYLANPYRKGSLHSKGLALDIGLADMRGNKLEFATGVDHFNSDSSHGYPCKPGEEAKCENRALLKSIMEAAGFASIEHEWWHYQKPGDTSAYPLIKVCGLKGAECEK
jgi:D-alanyl-D-alanine dipeptidase